MKLADLKTKIQEEVETHRQGIVDLSLKIHANPEIAWQEVKASGWLTDYLEKNGFKVERGICGLPTAFRASYGEGKPVVAYVCQYDAVTNTSHGCGHNIIAAAGVGASVAAKLAADQFGGTILVIGTPAEEVLGGKVIMVEKKAFASIDVALMVHPTGEHDWAGISSTNMTTLTVEFWGKEAHAAADPWDGISALQAMISAFNNINALRLHIKDKARVHGIITDGGKAANVVPEHCAGTFMIRSVEEAYLDELCEKVLSCFKGAALSIGARLGYRWGTKIYRMHPNHVLLGLWRNNMATLGRKVREIKDVQASSDMGNVSLVVPSIFPLIAIASKPLATHSAEFHAAAVSDAGNQGVIDSAKALAMTATDVMAQPETLSQVREEFLQMSKQVE
ncbi:M20 family metallopeptidase [Chloroflexota bacterium]